MLKSLYVWFLDEDGAVMVEYGVVLALIAVVCVAAVTAIGLKTLAYYQDCGARAQ